ncbi:Cobalt-zinc-cadmium resistance protein CzcA; Cation efflux system protein CusA [hydrothermal vent metagenome]|uniref:Cobalt-zinc-cadmium resistance protein CzcA Cation efflux system protein CusA n=1 Tax=hydrothermal vent metagenome TaxID=652676 RepID=A0A3B1E2E8_9ZZZZ
MIGKLIAWCIDNRFLVLMLTVILSVGCAWGVYTIPIDAIPDLSDVQVIIYTPWQGRDPQTIEDQVTYPLTTTMLSVPGVSDVRGYSFFGFSFVYVIFEDGTDMYWARSRVLEYMNQVQGDLPDGVIPRLGPDATGLGWVYIYTLEDTQNQYDQGELRALQDWYVRYQLTSVPGVAEVASIGGAIRQYQITLDPKRLLFYKIPLERVTAAVKNSNNDVGGKVVELTETEHMIRGRGYIQNVEDIENIVLSANQNGTPVLLRDVGKVQIGPDIRRGVAEKNGEGEVVAGVVVMRFGENALTVIESVKEKIKQIEAGLPEGVVIRSAYDRSRLIHRSIDTLKHTLAEELAITAIIIVVFLFHIRSALVAAVVLPLGILMAFLGMNLLGINANIMSISGIAVAIGTMVDSSIVVVENLHKHKEKTPDADHWQLVRISAQEVGPGLFTALLVVTVAFLPVFALEGQAGRLFKPLAATKTFAMAAAAFIAITVIPILTGLFVRGRIAPEHKNPVNRLMIWLYMPFIRFALRNKIISMFIAFSLLALTIVPWMKIGSEFMPPLREGDILYMPTSVPGLSVTEARRTLQIQDRLLSQFPEVRLVLGKIGRFSTPTDPAPLNMVETHIPLREEENWPQRLIAKGYLKQMGRQMLSELSAAGFLTEAGQKLDANTIAKQVEGMARADVNRQTRIELMQSLHKQLEKMRRSLKEHRRILLERGETVPSRFGEQDLEDQWIAEILPRIMQQIQPVLPQRIRQAMTKDLVEIIESQGGLITKRQDEAISHLREKWRGKISVKDIPLVRTTFAELTKGEMQKEISIPGMPNWWLMPIETRIGMLTTGMRGLLGLKLYGTDLDDLAEVAQQIESVLRDVPGTISVVSERAMGGHYLDIQVNRKQAARYGLEVGNIQRMIETAIGGMNIATTIEGRYRFPINVRYPRELRDDPEKLKRTLIATPTGSQIPLGQVADIKFVDGPPVIKSESGMLLVNIPMDIEAELDIGTYVNRAQAALDKAITEGKIKMPAGYYTQWSGQYEFMQQVRERLKIIIPITLAIIFVLIYFNMKNITETLITMLTLPFALIGGVWGMYWLGYNWSVAVAIGFIALAGLAAETGIIMHVYLDLAYKKAREEKGGPLSAKELYDAVIEGSVQRVRPKLMTVLTDFIALMPILWATSPGSGPMKRIAIPVIGGVITSAIHTLVLIPVYYTLHKRWEQWRELRNNEISE